MDNGTYAITRGCGGVEGRAIVKENRREAFRRAGLTDKDRRENHDYDCRRGEVKPSMCEYV